MKVSSTWRAVRLQEGELERALRRRHTLWLHGWCIGALVLGAMWLVAASLHWRGGESLALRYAITLGAGYLVYLAVLRVWGAVLARPSRDSEGGAYDLGGFDLPDLPSTSTRVPDPGLPPLRSGGGGDFGGGGAQASFGSADDGVFGAAGEALGKVGSVAAEADDGVVVVVPVLVVFALAAALLLGAGSLLLLYFGSEALLAVAIELAFGVVAGRTALHVSREGWLSAAIRLSWKPLLGALICAVTVGALIDIWLPQAQTLPEALRLLRQGR